VSILHAANRATPATARLGFAAHVSVGAPGVVIRKRTELVSVATVAPEASWMLTLGWRANA
jgi:hypothetical protein